MAERTDKKPVYIPPEKRVAYAPENKFLSKKDFIDLKRKRLEKEAMLANYAKEIDKQGVQPPKEAVEAVKAQKKMTKKT